MSLLRSKTIGREKENRIDESFGFGGRGVVTGVDLGRVAAGADRHDGALVENPPEANLHRRGAAQQSTNQRNLCVVSCPRQSLYEAAAAAAAAA